MDPDFPIQEAILDISPDSLARLESDLSKLDLAAKRALFAERVQKPVFFDTAFNYIDLPLDELLVKAGKAEAVAPATASASVVGKLGDVAQKAVQAAADVAAPKKAVDAAVKAVSARATRESTPAVETKSARSAQDEERDEATAAPGTPSKGWLGGWFGRGKA